MEATSRRRVENICVFCGTSVGVKPHYIEADPGHAHKRTGIENEGFFGIGLKANEKYRFTVGQEEKTRKYE